MTEPRPHLWPDPEYTWRRTCERCGCTPDVDAECREPMMGGVALVGHGSWGWGTTLDDAKARFKSVGHGRLSDGYVVYEFPADVEFLGVTGHGSIEWIDPTLQERKPTQTLVKGRKTK